jgi:hypothetical protein
MRFNPFFVSGNLLEDSLRRLIIVPETGLCRYLFKLAYLF